MHKIKSFFFHPSFRTLRNAWLYTIASVVFLFGVASTWNSADSSQLFFRLVLAIIWLGFAIVNWRRWLQQRHLNEQQNEKSPE